MNNGSHVITTNIIKEWSQTLLFTILDSIHDIVMVIDSDTTIVYINNAYAKILGVPVNKVLGRRLDAIEPNARALEVLRSGKVNHNLSDHLYSVGIDVIGSGFPLIEDGKIVGCVSIFNNISEVVQLNRELQRTKEVADYLQDQLNQREQLPLSFKEYCGRSASLQETLELASKVARTNSTVLIRGESGAGKGVLARAIHNSSRRKDKPIIIVNCAAIPEALLESELFGYEEGAFSGAKKGGKLGKFELAHGGTIFLDEIGDMSLSMQAKLLRVLQEKEMERLGATKTIKLDIRVIAATNRDLDKMIADGTFRQDLYYRLNIVPLTLPPLRERKEDILALAEKFLAQFTEETGGGVTISSEVKSVLLEHDWPGNVRELQNVIEHASIVRSGMQIEVRHLPAYLRDLYQHPQPLRDKPRDVKEAVANLERELMLEALAKHDDNRSAAMRELGMSRRAFYDKLRKYNIDKRE
ncbi:MAG: domain S-box [Firmicutes bacterium]|nr:domain S-box [Bacillota bacterium]